MNKQDLLALLSATRNKFDDPAYAGGTERLNSECGFIRKRIRDADRKNRKTKMAQGK